MTEPTPNHEYRGTPEEVTDETIMYFFRRNNRRQILGIPARTLSQLRITQLKARQATQENFVGSRRLLECELEEMRREEERVGRWSFLAYRTIDDWEECEGELLPEGPYREELRRAIARARRK